MKKMLRTGIFLVLVLNGWFLTAQDNVLYGRVSACNTGEIISNCTVQILELDRKTTSDKKGFFRLENVPKGNFLIHVFHSDFEEKIIPIKIGDNTDSLFVTLCDSSLLNFSEVVVTATRTERNLKDVPITVQVINAETIEKAQLPNFRDFLDQELAGVDFTNNGGYANINMLGFDGKYVLFLVDGERMAGETFDNIDYNRIDLSNIERVEIVKGASSSLYGSNAIGGVINIITKKPKSPFQLKASVLYGTDSDQNYTLSVGAKQKKISYGISAFFKMKEPYLLRDTEPLTQEYLNGKTVVQQLGETYIAGYTDYGLNPKFNFIISPKVQLEANAGYYFQERDNGGLEGYKIKDQFQNLRTGLKLNVNFNENHSLLFSSNIDDYQKSKYYTLLDEEERNYDNMIWRTSAVLDQKIRSKHSNVIGAEVYFEELHTQMFENETSYTKKDAQNYSLFAQQEWKLAKNFTLVTGARLDYHSQFKGYPTFRLSGMYNINRYFTMRGGYSGGFRAPTLKELYTDWYHPYGGGFQIRGNQNMKAEKSNNLNLSLDFTRKRFNATLMGQYSRIDEKINPIWLSNDTIQYQNVGNCKVVSSELSVSYRFKFKLNLTSAYSYVYESQRKESVVRPHTVTFRAEYTPTFIQKNSPTISVSGKYFSSMYVYGTTNISDKDNISGIDKSTDEYRVFYEPYTIWRLQFSIPLPYSFGLNAGINNLFDYKTKFSSFYSNISRGRTCYVGLKWDLSFEKKKDRLNKAF